MKNKILFYALLITAVSYAQKREGIIHFKDKSQKVGFIKYGPKVTAKNIKITDKVKLRKTKNSKEVIKFDYSLISKIDFIENGDVIYTRYFKISKENLNIIYDVTLLHVGIVNLYRNTRLDNYGNIINSYFVQRDDQNMVKIFPVGALGNGSNKAMIKYFKDCPKLGQYIKSRTFEKYISGTQPNIKKSEKFKKRLIEIVKYYNANCIKEN